MVEGVPEALREWETYYLIMGAAAGALTGLQFVVITLVTEAGVLQGTDETLAAFGSPNVMHFEASVSAKLMVLMNRLTVDQMNGRAPIPESDVFEI